MTPEPIANQPDKPFQQTVDQDDRRSSSWDIKNAPRNYFWLFIFQIGSAFFSFAAVWLITKNLGSEGYGGIVAVIAASQVAQVFVNWTGVSVVRFGVEEFIETSQISRTFWVRLIVLIVNLALVASLSPLWFPPLAGWLNLPAAYFWPVMLHFGVTVLWVHVQMSLQGAKLAKEQGFLQMVERFLIFAGFIALISSSGLTASTAIFCYIGSPAVVLIVGILRLRSYIFSQFALDKIFVHKVLAYSLPLFPMSLVGYLSGSYLDAIFVSGFLSTKDLGIYSVATQISGIALQLPTLANTLLIPLFISLATEDQSNRTDGFIRHVMPTTVLLWGAAMSLAGFAGTFLIPAVFGAEFVVSVRPAWILLAVTCLGLPVLIGYSALAHATSATYISMFAAVFAASVNLVLNYLLIPRFGLIGCAWATAASLLVSAGTYGSLLRRSFRIPISWVVIATIPATIGAAILSLNVNYAWTILLSMFLTILVAIWKRTSFSYTYRFVRNFT